MYCSTCGARLPANSSFCPRCGCACASASSTVRDAAAYAANFAPFGTESRERFSAKLSWDYFKKCWRDWSWEGRATRTEFWSFVAWKFAFQAAIYFVLGIGIWGVLIFTTIGAGMFSDSPFDDAPFRTAFPIFGLFGIFIAANILQTLIFLPSTIGVVVRRLHDANLNGALTFLCFLGQIGAIATIVFGVLEPTPTANRYGPNPRFDVAKQPEPTRPTEPKATQDDETNDKESDDEITTK